ncbi:MULTISPECIES: dTMP kinase [unclassified Lentimonas]|uniref:dTMP kinase n=1 Tax=unclassified Lentimonas TaxID=2630993 RepID=UPI001328AF07|nr:MULTISPECIES: dTMP kinase [unclassified Lentimonas]CAA6678875.1 Thymidylate kinase (EC [Lentimonas sp. CC4]CAA6684479.1 Thymidylate kinase (EC [Lentimonas sp. CC6]CAA7077441.1 Thymidylate kinase (EC [Lentimonas sp. CC4]CAA7171276.1 Thymidylate kinase (EC [Lentimonas sp. CC21]CAA7183306.1 Thymidylate kinase (EC [Lentimonas sp. CC8]
MAGLFVTFEGTEGCGKSTQIKALSDRLQRQGQRVLQTREPGGTPLGEAVRNLLQHDKAGEGMSPEAELLLFTASRAQLTRERILPAIAQGEIVLCDRFMDSTTVYQGVARQIDTEAVATINRFAVGEARPDLTILIDLSPEVGMARVRTRGDGQLDRMEQEAIEFFQAVRAGYLKLAESEPERFIVLDGNDSVEELEQQIWAAVQARLA